MPSSKTWKLQPLDININEVFKILRNKYVIYLIEDKKLKLLRILSSNE